MENKNWTKFNSIVEMATIEFDFATSKFGAFNNSHEGYAVLKEEIDELWDEIKDKQRSEQLLKEAIQVIAMGIRFVYDLVPLSPFKPKEKENE